MKKVGAVLSEARAKKQLTIQQIAQHTKIRSQFLEAIEQNEFQLLPPAVFVKGFLQKYARVVSLDEETVLALFRRDFKVGAKGNIIPREFLKPLSRKHSFFTPRVTAFMSVAVIVAMILGYAGLQLRRLQQPPLLEVYTPSDQDTVSPKFLVTGKSQLDAVVYINSTPVGVSPEGLFKYELIVSETGEQTVTIRAEDRKKRATVIEKKVIVK